MKIRYVSDLHLEQFLGRSPVELAEQFIPTHPYDVESVLVLAGDISSHFEVLRAFMKVVVPKFKHVVYVPGNHEYYGYDYDDWNKVAAELESQLDGKATLAAGNVRKIELDGVRFIACTLWADGGKSAMEQIMVHNGLWDFKRILKVRHGKQVRFSVNDMMDIHKEQRAQLESMLAESFEGKTVVVTHHLPSYGLCHPRFGTSINGGFASECSDLFYGTEAPHMWFFGHTHDTISRKIGETLVMANPKGYKNEHRDSQHNSYGTKYAEIE